MFENDFMVEFNDEEFGMARTYPKNFKGYEQAIKDLKLYKAKQDQRIAELEEQLKNCIRPKFKINQIVYIVDKYFNKIYELKITSIRISKFKDKHFNSISYNGHLEESLFETEEEAEAKLKELKGE